MRVLFPVGGLSHNSGGPQVTLRFLRLIILKEKKILSRTSFLNNIVLFAYSKLTLA